MWSRHKIDGADVSWAKFIQCVLPFELPVWLGWSVLAGFACRNRWDRTSLCGVLFASEFEACSYIMFALSSFSLTHCSCISPCVLTYLYLYLWKRYASVPAIALLAPKPIHNTILPTHKVLLNIKSLPCLTVTGELAIKLQHHGKPNRCYTLSCFSPLLVPLVRMEPVSLQLHVPQLQMWGIKQEESSAPSYVSSKHRSWHAWHHTPKWHWARSCPDS